MLLGCAIIAKDCYCCRRQLRQCFQAEVVRQSDVDIMSAVGRRRDEVNVSAAVGGVHSTAVVFTVSILFLSTLPAPLDAKPVCGPDEFYVRGQCFQCSTCPSYLIVQRLCTPNSDTLCGLSDFEFLHVVNNGAGRRTHQQATASSVSASPNSVVDIQSENSGTLVGILFRSKKDETCKKTARGIKRAQRFLWDILMPD